MARLKFFFLSFGPLFKKFAHHCARPFTGGGSTQRQHVLMDKQSTWMSNPPVIIRVLSMGASIQFRFKPLYSCDTKGTHRSANPSTIFFSNSASYLHSNFTAPRYTFFIETILQPLKKTRHSMCYTVVFLNRRVATRYRALASIIPGPETFFWNMSF